ncbi:hypothetical protein LV779_24490 [Streptomyces thinghirensis]|nr:hypothetical protein [Streptomyces thinghirensis]
MVGDRWCLLPHASDFIDPLFSSGLAVTVMALNALSHRLIDAVRQDDFDTSGSRTWTTGPSACSGSTTTWCPAATSRSTTSTCGTPGIVWDHHHAVRHERPEPGRRDVREDARPGLLRHAGAAAVPRSPGDGQPLGGADVRPVAGRRTRLPCGRVHEEAGDRTHLRAAGRERTGPGGVGHPGPRQPVPLRGCSPSGR